MRGTVGRHCWLLQQCREKGWSSQPWHSAADLNRESAGCYYHPFFQ
jgi:hypothetical protein